MSQPLFTQLSKKKMVSIESVDKPADEFVLQLDNAVFQGNQTRIAVQLFQFR